MIRVKANIPGFDEENEVLFKASGLLESIGNDPGMTTSEFYLQLLVSDYPAEDHESLYLAAIAIESMMSVGSEYDEESTVH
tara:strand:- start:306 stop:548 length:243 start_codon:yes stop_codon:yes gene_type:complete